MWSQGRCQEKLLWVEELKEQRTLLLSRKANTGFPSRGLFFRAQFNIQPGASTALSQMKAFGRMVKG
ncbi:unnamed protein product [Rangifer tarandus platyrhynchus]|uniref:Uncharacterized protein n=1 Tax=Rangifer tarandus platyrhynchus TaxID=3082113 RepID=A0AC59YRC9_RANTA